MSISKKQEYGAGVGKRAEDEGFEPSIGFPIHAFQACALGRYANPPALAARESYQRAKSNGVASQPRHLRLAQISGATPSC